jgi:putative FmdB family regulatory protein
MPIYEYECLTCGLRFERLVRPTTKSTDTATSCPSCLGGTIKQLVSLFAVNCEGTRHKNLEHGRHLAKKDQLEKRHADIEEAQHHHD